VRFGARAGGSGCPDTAPGYLRLIKREARTFGPKVRSATDSGREPRLLWRSGECH
jgi:hypothetical protein